MNNKIERYDIISDYITFDKSIMNAINMQYDNYYDMFYNYTYVIKPIFNSMMFMQTDIKEVTVYNSGNLAKHGDFILPLDNIKSRKWFKKVFESSGNTWIYENGKISILRRMINVNNSNTNILRLQLDYKAMFEEIDNIMDNYGLFVVNEADDIIYSTKRFEKEFQSYQLSYEQLMKHDGESMIINGSEYILQREKLASPEWSIYFYKPINSLDLDVGVIVRTVLFAIVISLLMTILFSVIFSKIIVTRIELLTKNMMHVDENNFKVTITSNSEDEIGTLIRTFGHMLNKIDTLIKEVYESKLRQKEAEMVALQAQVNPHFLYNVLSSINWKAIMMKADEISRTTQLLATFYRTALNSGKNIITIKEELENTRSYIEIQSILHNGSFEVVYDVDEEIYQYETIKLILQPIAENAIEHGLDRMKGQRKLLLVTAKGVNNKIHFEIQDNGRGIEENALAELLISESKGYGLKNVNERIRLYFGEEYGLQIESKMEEGTKVSVVVPAVPFHKHEITR
jgi:two-component system sensor histidine kinase YesM